MISFSEEFLSENDFEAVLVTLCCYSYDANVSEAVENIATDPNDYYANAPYISQMTE